MNFRLILVTTLVLIITVLSSHAYAKDYAIEIIIFTNKDGLQQTAEQFSANHIIPVPNNGLALNSLENDTEWQPISEDEYILNNVADKLNRSSKYRILKHIAWRQPAIDKSDSVPIMITAGRDYADLYPERAYKQIEFSDTSSQANQEDSGKVHELAGTINVAITRYIHVYSDLVYRLPRSNPSYVEDALNREQVLVDYAVNSHRRMRSRELHYIDHPLVGILVEATPIEEETTDE